MDKLKELIERAILVAYGRDGDVDTEDGTFATTDVDEMIRLEMAIEELFGLDAQELAKTLNSNQIIDGKLKDIMSAGHSKK
ncbi:hypothetical protein [Photobacterium damselae]|uniref:hypothetical protein n=1 Tax=Photobacterium damselae TaxID=38293 RepID=UPI001F2B416B|nr:hypothetical protein [Photobacterium damselae]UKA04874.1 hypothetical protein IHC89_21765 [Photobacterium damselae subsp. damselae]